MATKIKIINLGEYQPFDETPAEVTSWYDRHTKDWVIQILNKDGYEIISERVGTKEDKEFVVSEYKRNYQI